MVAIKTENMNAVFSQLVKEIQIYPLLASVGFPRLIKKGVSAENGFIYIATNFLGPSLEDLACLCSRKFTLKTSLMIFYQMLERLEYMHSRNLIHRDIKPENIMMGLGDESDIVTMIDFGLCRSIIDPKTNKHIKFMGGKNLIGTCRFVSLNSHLGYELSRRDDLLTLCNMIVYFVRGNLPW